MGAKLTGAELNAAHPHGADQENPAPSLGLAPRRQEPCLPSQVRRIVLAEGGAACARARDDLRREWRLRMERTQDWLRNRWCAAGWISPSVSGQGRLCWIIAGRTRWRWPNFLTDFIRSVLESGIDHRDCARLFPITEQSPIGD